MIKAISGCQTGADIASVDAALVTGFETGGWMPRGCVNETGPHPEYQDKYGVKPIVGGADDPASQYRERTRMNVQDSEATIWLEWTKRLTSPGFFCTQNAAIDAGRPIAIIYRHWFNDGRGQICKRNLVALLRQFDAVNFAGSRESKATGIYQWVYGLLVEVFRELKS
jgi:hypothetical protein